MMSTKRLNSVQYYTWLIMTIIILPFIISSFYANPTADDFDTVIKVHRLGFWETQKNWYFTWTGRYFSTILLSISPIVFGQFFLYKIVSLALICTTIWMFLRPRPQVFSNYSSNSIASALALIILFFGMPTIVEDFYWYPGYVTYHFANLTLFALLFTLHENYGSQSTTGYAAGIILCIITVGCNESGMVFTLLYCSAGLVFHYYSKRKVHKYYLLLLIVTVAFSLVSVLAPGNSVRAALIKPQLTFLEKTRSLIYWGVWYNARWAILGFCCVGLFLFVLPKVQLRESILKVPIWLSIVVLACIPVIGILPGVMIMGVVPPLRTLNFAFFQYAVGFTLVILLTINKYRSFFSRTVVTVISLLSLTTMGVFLTRNNNVTNAYYDLISGKSARFDRSYSIRYRIIANSTASPVVVDSISSRPSTLFSQDITSDSNDWRNKAYSEYFNRTVLISRDEVKQ